MSIVTGDMQSVGGDLQAAQQSTKGQPHSEKLIAYSECIQVSNDWRNACRVETEEFHYSCPAIRLWSTTTTLRTPGLLETPVFLLSGIQKIDLRVSSTSASGKSSELSSIYCLIASAASRRLPHRSCFVFKIL